MASGERAVDIFRLPEREVTAQISIDQCTHPWPEELDFVAHLRHTRCIPDALKIQAWLATPDARQRPIVPIKERSLEIFGYEKRLEELLGGDLFKNGRLTSLLLVGWS